MDNKEFSIVIYDRMDRPYFLILHNKPLDRWEFVNGNIQEGETPEKAAIREFAAKSGLSKGKIQKKIDLIDNRSIFIIESSMNIPVHVNAELGHDTYLWSTVDSVEGKLSGEEKEKFLIALKEISQSSGLEG